MQDGYECRNLVSPLLLESLGKEFGGAEHLVGMRKNLITIVVGVMILVASFTAGIYLYYLHANSPTPTPHYDDEWQGYNIIAGNNSVSDGRLIVRLNNYRVVYGSDILFQVSTGINGTPPGPPMYASGGDGQDSGVFVLANVTFQNIGLGSAFIGTSFVEITNGAANYSNGEYFANASFPGEYPNTSLPSSRSFGGTNLPSGSYATYWIIFNMPQISNTSGIALKQYMFFEREYGGTYVGQGAYNCPCGDPMVEFIILPRSV